MVNVADPVKAGDDGTAYGTATMAQPPGVRGHGRGQTPPDASIWALSEILSNRRRDGDRPHTGLILRGSATWLSRYAAARSDRWGTPQAVTW